MRIYIPSPKPVLRITFRESTKIVDYLSIVEATPEEFVEYIKKLVQENKSVIFEAGCTTSIDIREAKGGKNGSSRSIRFKWVSAMRLRQLLLDNLELYNE